MDVIPETSCPQIDGSLLLTISAVALILGVVLGPANSAQAQEPTTRIEFLKYGSMATHVDQSRTGEYIAIGLRRESNGQGQVVLWSTSEQERVWSKSFPTTRAPRVAFDSTGARLAVGTTNGEITIWDLTDGTTATPRGKGPPVTALKFGPGGALGAGLNLGSSGSMSQRGEVRIWSNGVATQTASLHAAGPVRALAFRPGTSQLVFVESETQFTLWNYRFNTTKTINAANFCTGSVKDVALPSDSPNIYFVTKSYVQSEPDHFCVLNAESRSLIGSYPRMNIQTLEPITPSRIAFSRGRYVYLVNLQTGTEQIVFESENEVLDLSYKNGRLVVANSDVVALNL